jgi:hypothetical protein
MEDKRGDDRYQYYLKLKGGHLHFKKIDRYSPSRLLVEELMIFYNSSLATYASELKMPLIHRNIEQFPISIMRTRKKQRMHILLQCISIHHPQLSPRHRG